MDLRFSKSRGPGGQNVYKVATRVTLRFNCHEADWLPEDARTRLVQQQRAKVNREGFFAISSDRHRTQKRNIEDCFQKLQEIVDKAAVPPKERNLKTGISEHTKRKRKEGKRHRAKYKSHRGDASF